MKTTLLYGVLTMGFVFLIILGGTWSENYRTNKYETECLMHGDIVMGGFPEFSYEKEIVAGQEFITCKWEAAWVENNEIVTENITRVIQI